MEFGAESQTDEDTGESNHQGPIGPIELLNNIIVTRSKIKCTNPPIGDGVYTFDSNLYWSGVADGGFGYFDGELTLEEFRNEFRQEQNGQEGDPMFEGRPPDPQSPEDARKKYANLTDSESIARDAGTELTGADHDYGGNPRRIGEFDKGAFEIE